MKKKICLVLGGGGSKGLAHVGVIKALVENDFEITQIAGTSAGALIGGLYAANPDYRELEKIVENISYYKLIKILVDWPVRNGLVRGRKMEKFLNRLCGQKSIENLPIKFKAVCTDLITGQKYVFDQGKLVTAIRASCAVPAIFSPIKYEGKILIDGGAISPIPVSEVEAKNGEKVVAVGLYSKIFPKSYRKLSRATLPQIAYSSMQTMVCQLSERNLNEADIQILPPVEDINVLNFVRAKKYIQIGYDTTIKMMPTIEKLFS
ncbi:MAG: patatin-like phospholipase family protein [Candidatus Shapirobacteria bacterium]|jgi:NTE family protein